jgi:hypothetical protein
MPRGDLMQVAFFHNVLSQTAGDLRAAIEERWRAFGTYSHTPPPPRSGPPFRQAGQ